MKEHIPASSSLGGDYAHPRCTDRTLRCGKSRPLPRAEQVSVEPREGSQRGQRPPQGSEGALSAYPSRPQHLYRPVEETEHTPSTRNAWLGTVGVTQGAWCSFQTQRNTWAGDRSLPADFEGSQSLAMWAERGFLGRGAHSHHGIVSRRSGSSPQSSGRQRPLCQVSPPRLTPTKRRGACQQLPRGEPGFVSGEAAALLCGRQALLAWLGPFFLGDTLLHWKGERQQKRGRVGECQHVSEPEKAKTNTQERVELPPRCKEPRNNPGRNTREGGFQGCHLPLPPTQGLLPADPGSLQTLGSFAQLWPSPLPCPRAVGGVGLFSFARLSLLPHDPRSYTREGGPLGVIVEWGAPQALQASWGADQPCNLPNNVDGAWRRMQTGSERGHLDPGPPLVPATLGPHDLKLVLLPVSAQVPGNSC